MGVAKLELGIDMGGRTLYCDVPLSPRVIFNGTKIIAETTTGYVIHQRQSGGNDYIEVRDGGNNLVATLYDSTGPTRVDEYATADGFGIVKAIDPTATGYYYLTRDASVKNYVISEDHEIVEGMSKEEIEEKFGAISGSVIQIANGGTGATNAATARTNLGITPANIGAAASSHTHNASDVNDGTLNINRLPTVTIAKGGTGATSAATARTNLGITPANIGAAASSHKHAASDVNSGTLGSDRLPTVPISKGGTGATDRINAFKNITNQNVGSDAKYFVSLTENWGKAGYSSAADTCAALGIKCPALWSGGINTVNQQITFAWGGYNAYIIGGSAGGTSFTTVIIPANDLRTSQANYIIADESAYVTFGIWYNGSTGYLKLTGKNGSGTLTHVWGIK